MSEHEFDRPLSEILSEIDATEGISTLEKLRRSRLATLRWQARSVERANELSRNPRRAEYEARGGSTTLMIDLPLARANAERREAARARGEDPFEQLAEPSRKRADR